MDRRRVALIAAAAHWALAVAIQLGCFCAYLMPAGVPAWDAVRYLTTMPFLEGQALVVAAALGVLAYLLAGIRYARWLLLPLHATLAAFLLADQLFYKISFDHLRPSLFEVGSHWSLSVALSSLVKEMDAPFYFAAIVAVAGTAGLWVAMAKGKASPVRLRPWATAAAVLLVAGIPGMSSARYYHLNEHPLVAALQDWRAGGLAGSMARKQWKPPAAEMVAVNRDPELARLREIGRRRKRRPNVVMVVMESVGAVNLLNEAGLPRPLYAPNLARLAQAGVTFDSIYVPFPATTRSLVSLHTGGRQMTEGVISGLENRYTGPMLGRELQQLGYTTALFSSERLDVEDCDVFLRQVGYDHFQDFEQDLANRDPRNLIHSWGAREEYTLGLIQEWLNGVREGGKPFYLEYMTVATHHPYGAPAGYPAPFAGKDAQSQYLNALHYTDRAIGYLVAMLARMGVLDDTLIVVTGDHGEGFGDRHAGNYLHKSFLYEENVRGFLTISDAAWRLAAPVRSGRIASNGDVASTVLDYLGARDPSLPGHSLWAENFDQGKVFFYKLALPEQWGLRDGKWKYIEDIRTGKAELYDLEEDPGETRNLAAREPARLEQYGALCEQWFVRSDAEFTARLENYRAVGGRTLLPVEFRQPGPKILSTGHQTADRFAESAVFSVNERPVAWTSWVPLGMPHLARWRWTSPSGVVFAKEVQIAGEWTVSYTPFPGPLPLEPGRWVVEIEGTGLKSAFSVSARSPVTED
ncbi:MAG TPA: sulfatase-like hydrolase/transferase [Bryobacteraceae bacterium]|nr:sulfatase-like hydrolase/transferase [Bryobacteraceae bacterium]